MKTYAVVAVSKSGHRTVLQATVGEDRVHCERFATRRDRHPNAVALGMTHEVVEVTDGRRPSIVSGPVFVELVQGGA